MSSHLPIQYHLVLIIIVVAACLLVIAIVAVAYHCSRSKGSPPDIGDEASVGMVDMKQLQQREELNLKTAAKAKAKARRRQLQKEQKPAMPPPPVLTEDDLGGGFIDDNELPLYALAESKPRASPTLQDRPRPPVIYASLGTLRAGDDKIIGEDAMSAVTEYVLIDHERTTVGVDAGSVLHVQCATCALLLASVLLHLRL